MTFFLNMIHSTGMENVLSRLINSFSHNATSKVQPDAHHHPTPPSHHLRSGKRNHHHQQQQQQQSPSSHNHHHHHQASQNSGSPQATGSGPFSVRGVLNSPYAGFFPGFPGITFGQFNGAPGGSGGLTSLLEAHQASFPHASFCLPPEAFGPFGHLSSRRSIQVQVESNDGRNRSPPSASVSPAAV